MTIHHPTQPRHSHHLLDARVRAPVRPVTRVSVGGHVLPRLEAAAPPHLQIGRVQTTVVNIAENI